MSKSAIHTNALWEMYTGV